MFNIIKSFNNLPWHQDFLRGRSDDLADIVAAVQEPVDERLICKHISYVITLKTIWD